MIHSYYDYVPLIYSCWSWRLILYFFFSVLYQSARKEKCSQRPSPKSFSFRISNFLHIMGLWFVLSSLFWGFNYSSYDLS